MSDRRQPLWLTIALLLLACPVFAQRDRDNYATGPVVEIAGQIQLPEGGPPAPNVTVRLERFSGGILDQMPADSHGKFRFTNLQRGYYTIYVSAPGYRQASQQADMQVVSRTYLVFELVADKSNLVLTPPANSVIDVRVPREAQAEFAKAGAALQDKKVKDALQHLTKAVQLYPDFFEAQFLLGTTYMNELQLADAEAALRRALEIKPENAAVLVSLGEVERREKRYADAEKSLEEALKLDDKSWQGYFTLARVYWEAGDILKAGPPLGHTLQLKPDFAEAHLLAGNVLLRVGQPERAVTEYEEYLRLSPKGEFAAQTRELVKKIKAKADQKK
jgi:tetratricopeptide (TPR) repeat protein